MGTNVSDVTEYKTNEHEEEADQRKGCGRTDHLEDTNSGLRGHLDISGHHILYGKTSTFLLPSQETNPPEARVEGHAYLCTLVEGKDDAFLQVEPVVGAYGDPQQAQAANSEHAAQQRQRLPAT